MKWPCRFQKCVEISSVEILNLDSAREIAGYISIFYQMPIVPIAGKCSIIQFKGIFDVNNIYINGFDYI